MSITVRDEYETLWFASNPVIVHHWDMLGGEAFEGYKTVKGYEKFMSDCYNFLGLWETAGKNPHLYDKLLKRANSHGFARDFILLCEVYNYERLTHLRYANESIDEWEFNQIRKGM